MPAQRLSRVNGLAYLPGSRLSLMRAAGRDGGHSCARGLAQNVVRSTGRWGSRRVPECRAGDVGL